MKQIFSQTRPLEKSTMNRKSIVIIGLVLCIGLLISACGHKGDPHPSAETVKAPNVKL